MLRPTTHVSRPIDQSYTPKAEKSLLMPKIETIKASDAPPRPVKMSTSSVQILNVLEGLKKDEVLRLQPDPGKSIRGLKSAVSRLASRNRLKLESWSDEDQKFLYVRQG